MSVPYPSVSAVRPRSWFRLLENATRTRSQRARSLFPTASHPNSSRHCRPPSKIGTLPCCIIGHCGPVEAGFRGPPSGFVATAGRCANRRHVAQRVRLRLQQPSTKAETSWGQTSIVARPIRRRSSTIASANSRDVVSNAGDPLESRRDQSRQGPGALNGTRTLEHVS